MTGARILIFDDEPQIRLVLKSTLCGQGYEAFDARTGEEAVDAIRERRLDLVLLDVDLPGMRGLENVPPDQALVRHRDHHANGIARAAKARTLAHDLDRGVEWRPSFRW
jgi:DNA-binding NtrC family response regulator